jgi:endonuclease V-like protein UPF0215 family
MEEQASLVEKFAQKNAKEIEETKKDIQNHLDEKQTRFKLLESSLEEFRKTHNDHIMVQTLDFREHC